MIKRTDDLQNIKMLQDIFPVVGILGARQSGKTTIARQFDYDHYFDLENPRDLAKLAEPQTTLEYLQGLIVIDEIQRKPNLFPLLRFLVDSNERQKYLILGSASRDLMQQSSESLAGRIGYHRLGGFSLRDVGHLQYRNLWVRGGFPSSFLATSERASVIWRDNYIRTFVERDIPQLGIQIPALTINRFWTMLSHYHGQIINYAELGRSFGISDMTIRKYIDILENTFMVRVLPPRYANLGKRLVKRPKIYIRDSGIFHRLQSIENEEQLLANPKLGASWEGFSLELACRHIQQNGHPVYFWATHTGAEVDLFWQQGGKNLAIEFKYMDAPRLTKSMQIALDDLELEHLWIVYPGPDEYPLHARVTALPVTAFALANPFLIN
ncbi:ATP-binding protein [candidate division KSB1 bacterium]|nr:ATP-binding protein [candidate division KSB1 bacterium]